MSSHNKLPYSMSIYAKQALYSNYGYASEAVIITAAIILALIGLVTLIATSISGQDANATGTTGFSGSETADDDVNRPQMVDFDYNTNAEEYGAEIAEEESAQTLTIPPLPQNEKTIGDATIIELTGCISEKNQNDEYYFTPEYDGCYNIRISELISGTYTSIEVNDHLGKNVARYSHYYNNNNLTLYDLTAGERYKISLHQESGFSDYILTVGCQKETIDISGYSIIHDTIEFANQVNTYLFTPELDGQYTLTISDVLYDVYMEIYVYDHLGYKVNYDNYYYNNNSLSLSNLKSGEEYTVKVLQNTSYSPYKLSIGKQKSTASITNNTVITDSIEFCYQENKYFFTANRDGDVEFLISDISSDNYFTMKVLNNLKVPVCSDNYFYNSNSFTLYDVKKGDTFEIQIAQSTGYSGYTLTVR